MGQVFYLTLTAQALNRNPEETSSVLLKAEDWITPSCRPATIGLQSFLQTSLHNEQELCRLLAIPFLYSVLDLPRQGRPTEPHIRILWYNL